MKKWLIVFVLLLKISLFSDSFPLFLNNYLLDNFDYFNNILLKYKKNQKIFDSQNYFLNNEQNLLPEKSSLLLFQERLLHSNNNNFYLNINLLSGTYNGYKNYRNKFINIFYGYNLIRNFYIGLEGMWNESSNNDFPPFNNVQNYYFIKWYFWFKKIFGLLNYQLNANSFLKGINFYVLYHIKDILKINIFFGYNPDYFGLEDFLQRTMGQKLDVFQTISNFYLALDPYLRIILYYHKKVEADSSFEFTLSLYKKLLFQFYYSDKLEAKRIFLKIPLLKYYKVVPGVEFNKTYYYFFSLTEKTKNYKFTFLLKKSLNEKIKQNLSLILKYTYYIN